MRTYLLIIVSLCFVLIGCNKADNYEKLTIEQAEKVLKKNAKNPESCKISEMETAYKQDSICIVRFTGTGENSFGGSASSRYEFVMLSRNMNTDKQITLCMLNDLEEEESVLRKYKTTDVSRMSKNPESIKTKEDSIYSYCAYAVVMHTNRFTCVKELTKDKDILEALNESGI